MKKFIILFITILSLILISPKISLANDFTRFYLTDDLGGYKAIIEDAHGSKYLIEYGIGCLSLWRYEGSIAKKLYIDIGGSFLDGIGDTLYLLDTDDKCKIWDAKQLSAGSIYSNGGSSLQSCPKNSTVKTDGKCHCDDGYVTNGDVCISSDDDCKLKYGPNSIFSNNQCVCRDGYTQEFDPQNKYCWPKNICPKGALFLGMNNGVKSCKCPDSYTTNKDGDLCVTQDAYCKERYGAYSYFNYPDRVCACVGGSFMDTNMTACVTNASMSQNTVKTEPVEEESITDENVGKKVVPMGEKRLPTPIKSNTDKITLPKNLDNTIASSTNLDINSPPNKERPVNEDKRQGIFNGIKSLIQNFFKKLKFW